MFGSAKLIQIFQMFFQIVVDLKNRIQTVEQNSSFLTEIQSILSDFFNTTQNSMQNSFDARLDEVSREIFSRIECQTTEICAKHSYVCDELQSWHILFSKTSVQTSNDTIMPTACWLLEVPRTFRHIWLQSRDGVLPLTLVVQLLTETLSGLVSLRPFLETPNQMLEDLPVKPAVLTKPMYISKGVVRRRKTGGKGKFLAISAVEGHAHTRWLRQQQTCQIFRQV